ncbi:MAG: ABC transporter substrate-binding protein [Deltaproteobacteria bacterium]
MSPRVNAITVAALAALCCCDARRRRTPDDTLVVVLQERADNVDPRFTLSNYDAAVSHMIAIGLTTVSTDNGEPALALASSIVMTDPVTADITLADAKFSDGTEVTADDVARTFQTVADPKCGSLYSKIFRDRWTLVEAIDPKHVRMHMVQPLGTLRSDLEFGIVSFHGAPPGVCRLPGVIGAGPWVLKELTPYIARFDANPYFAKPPKLPHLELRFVSDTAARILMLVGGSADLLENAVRADLVDEVAERERVHVAAAHSLLLTYMLLNNEDPVLRDLRVREAIALTLDRQAVIDARFQGRAVLATGLLPPTHWAYNGDVPRWTRDLPRARALLDAAGYRPGPDGVRLRLTYKTSADAFRVAIAHVLAAQLAEVGIAVEVRPFEFATFFADIKRGNYQIATMQTTPITEPDFYFSYFHSSRIPTDEDRDAQNRWAYRNADFDRVAAAGRHEIDRDKRKGLYAEAQRLVARDLPVIPLWHEDNVVLSNVDVQGYAILPDGRFAGLPGVAKM